MRRAICCPRWRVPPAASRPTMSVFAAVSVCVDHLPVRDTRCSVSETQMHIVCQQRVLRCDQRAATAQLLLPGSRSASSEERTIAPARGPHRAGFTSSGDGIGSGGIGAPIAGASHSVPRWYMKRYSASGISSPPGHGGFGVEGGVVEAARTSTAHDRYRVLSAQAPVFARNSQYSNGRLAGDRPIPALTPAT